jgi:hypothetical protein
MIEILSRKNKTLSIKSFIGAIKFIYTFIDGKRRYRARVQGAGLYDISAIALFQPSALKFISFFTCPD